MSIDWAAQAKCDLTLSHTVPLGQGIDVLLLTFGRMGF
jgi:hypothetical protein